MVPGEHPPAARMSPLGPLKWGASSWHRLGDQLLCLLEVEVLSKSRSQSSCGGKEKSPAKERRCKHPASGHLLLLEATASRRDCACGMQAPTLSTGPGGGAIAQLCPTMGARNPLGHPWAGRTSPATVARAGASGSAQQGGSNSNGKRRLACQRPL